MNVKSSHALLSLAALMAFMVCQAGGCGQDGFGGEPCTKSADCPDGYYCDLSSKPYGCVVGTKCDDGTKQCSGTIIQTCTNNTWVSGTDCAVTSQGCLSGACTGSPDCSPQSGGWIYTDWTVASNDCNNDGVVGQGDGTFGIDNHRNGTFTVTPGDGTASFDCTVESAANIDCTRTTIEVDLNPLQAVLNGTAIFDAHCVTDNQHVAGQQIGKVSCTGVQCAAAETSLNTTFPCRYIIDFQGQWQHD